MALPKSLTYLRLGTGYNAIEVYLDTICPFSAKISKSITENVLPLIRNGGPYEGKFSVIIRPYPQPFHYLAHHHAEAIYVFGAKYPTLFWAYMTELFDNIETFKNGPGSGLSGDATRDLLTELAFKTLESNNALGSGPKSQAFGDFRAALNTVGSPNGGNEGTLGLKYNVKHGRQNGIHVTPTCLFDGLKEDSVSSSWGKVEWEKFIKEKVESPF